MKCVETMQLAALLLERTTEQISDNEVSGVVRVPVDDTPADERPPETAAL
jgi:hypothetical protein